MYERSGALGAAPGGKRLDMTRTFDTPGLLVLRVVVGFLIAAHGFQKLTTVGPAGFERGTLDSLGVPAPVLARLRRDIRRVIDGVLLILRLLTRLAALVLTIDLIVAIALVKVDVGLIAQRAACAELDLAYIAAFVAHLLMGPGAGSLDPIGLERGHPGRGRRSGGSDLVA